MFSQRFPALDQSTPKILSKTTFKFDIRSYKTTEDVGIKQQGQSVQTKRQKTQPSFKQMPVFKKLVQKKLFNSLVNPIQQFDIPCNWEQKYHEKEKECQELQEKNQEQQKLMEQLERKFLSLKLAYESLQEEKQENDVLNIKKQMNSLEMELKEQLHRAEQQLWRTQEQNSLIQDKFKQFEQKAKLLQQQTIHLHQALLCKYCGKLVNDAVTIIPCAHTYCGTCNKGYQKKCFLCGDEAKIEATYYNQFMSEIINMYDTFQTIVQIFLR
ncbi:unnamed protein product [Paramecium primaurelia]|uniref:RING-type domain-containing protein n=1 Tax=Paramecium primaurelia TaxID=5886 RepID=A0A8S1LBC5_PARPR|nr:unnamed protein product [Paramecium primaurelia]